MKNPHLKPSGFSKILGLTSFLAAIVLSVASNIDARDVRLKVLCLELAPDLPIVQYRPQQSKNEYQQLELFTSAFTPSFTCSVNADALEFFVEDKDAQGKPVMRVIAAARLKPAAEQALIFVPSAAGDPMPYKVMSFDDTERAAPFGTVRVVNLSAMDVRLVIAGAEMPPVTPGLDKVYPPVKAVDDWNMYSVRIEFHVKDQRWVPVATQSWKQNEDRRQWLVTAIDAKTKQPSLKLYQDLRPIELQVPQ